MKNKISLIFIFLSALFVSSCTDLEETMFDTLTPDQFTPGDGPVDIIYASLRGSSVRPFTYPGSEFVWFVQTSTDEVCVPIRTSGHWKDGYIYREMQQHTWDANNNIILSAWNYCYNIIGVCNVELRKDRYSLNLNQQAQIRLVRAYAYLMALDMFGNIPIIDENHSGSMPAKSTRAQVFEFVKSELEDPIMDNLRDRRTSDIWNQAILNTLKARLYLNANVYLASNYANPLADSDDIYMENLEKVLVSCQKIIDSPRDFGVTDYFRSFYTDNDSRDNSKDIICAIPYTAATTVGNYLQLLGFTGGSQNGFGVPIMSNVVNGPCVNPGISADDPNALYNLFDKNDIRRLSIIGTPLRHRFTNTGEPANPNATRPLYNSIILDNGMVGEPLLYNPFFTGGFEDWNGLLDNPRAARAGDGARMLKYEMKPNQAWEMDNDLVLMRYTEVLYMKAEALIRLGRGGEALEIFQTVLSQRGYNGADIGYEAGEIEPHQALSKRNIATSSLDAMPTAMAGTGDAILPTLDFMEREWRREFVFEGRRRTDMIRFGSFFGTWGLKNMPSQSYRAIFPIPASVLASNPALAASGQNPGY